MVSAVLESTKKSIYFKARAKAAAAPNAFFLSLDAFVGINVDTLLFRGQRFILAYFSPCALGECRFSMDHSWRFRFMPIVVAVLQLIDSF